MTSIIPSFINAVRDHGERIGLQVVRFGRPYTGPWGEAYRQWVAAGYAGEMAYMTRDPEKRSDPARVMDDVQSIVIAAMNYFPGKHREEVLLQGDRGYIANYALRMDYHDVLKARLEGLLAFMTGHWVSLRDPQGASEGSYQGRPDLRGRVYVDTGPLLEKALAQQAGVGWIGKNTNLITKRVGSWYVLGVILLNVALEEDDPAEDHCGRCTRCIDICPTGAIVEPYVLDARRCISYLTIELKGSIPEQFRPQMGNRVFGCDDCQSVCPWNRFAQAASEMAFLPREELNAPRLIDLMSLDEDGFRRMFQGSPVKRIKRRGLLRNVAVALGNLGSPEALPALQRALNDPEPLIREHSAWAIQQIQKGMIANGKVEKVEKDEHKASPVAAVW